MASKRRTAWEVELKPPNKKKRLRNWVLVRYPPTGAVNEKGERLRSARWSSGKADYEEALAEARKAEARLNAASGLLPEQTVKSVVESYIAGNKLSESFEENCTSALKAAPAFAKLKPSKVNKATLLLARDAMRPGRSNTTVNGYVGSLKAAWNWAGDRDMVLVPWPRIKRLPGKSAKRPFESEEVQPVLDYFELKPRGFVDWFSYFSVLADTSIRPGELVRVKGKHVDRKRCRILIARNKTGPQGTERIEEWVRVPRATMALLPERLDHEWLWPSRGKQSRGHVTTNGALIALKKAFRACGLSWVGRLDQVSFRRYWIDAADEEGISQGDSMKQAGHTKAETHQGYRRNSRRAVPQEVVERVWRRRQRLAPQTAPQERVEQDDVHKITPGEAGPYAASSLCSR